MILEVGTKHPRYFFTHHFQSVNSQVVRKNSCGMQPDWTSIFNHLKERSKYASLLSSPRRVPKPCSPDFTYRNFVFISASPFCPQPLLSKNVVPGRVIKYGSLQCTGSHAEQYSQRMLEPQSFPPSGACSSIITGYSDAFKQKLQLWRKDCPLWIRPDPFQKLLAWKWTTSNFHWPQPGLFELASPVFGWRCWEMTNLTR
jgi:hypothetical protein